MNIELEVADGEFEKVVGYLEGNALVSISGKIDFAIAAVQAEGIIAGIIKVPAILNDLQNIVAD